MGDEEIQSWTLEEGEPGHPTVVVFGGINSGFGLPPFEFERTLTRLGVTSLIVRDTNQSWYTRGLPGIGDDSRHVAEWLNRVLGARRSRPVVFVGNSAGGYAALRFAPLCEPSHVIAFSPQTFLTRRLRALHGDFRWRAQLARARKADPRGAVWDLTEELRETGLPCTAEVHYAEGHRLDSAHARRLAVVPSLTLVSHPVGDHGLVRKLRDAGDLDRILQRAVAAR